MSVVPRPHHSVGAVTGLHCPSELTDTWKAVTSDHLIFPPIGYSTQYLWLYHIAF